MNNVIYSFVITTLAGLSTLVGFFVIYIKKDQTKVLVSSLSFASGVMVAVSITDLIPSSFNYLSNTYFSIFAFLLTITSIVLGIVFSMLIDKYLPGNSDGNNIYRLGILSMLVIMIHNIPEGIATFMTSTDNLKLGLSLSIAIALHNIPEGISISYPIFYSTKSKTKSFLYTFIAGISELLGAILAYLFLSKFITNNFMGILLGVIAGIMLQISFYEFLPTAKKYKENKYLIIFFVIGFIVMVISHLI